MWCVLPVRPSDALHEDHEYTKERGGMLGMSHF